MSALRARRRRPNLARWNHVLIPATSAGRDRARKNPVVRALAPLLWVLFSLSDEGRFLATFSVLVGFAGLEVAQNQVHVLWAALTAALVGSLLVRPLFALPGVRLSVQPPRRATVGEDAAFVITLENDGPRDHHTVRVGGPMLPWDGRWTAPRGAVKTLPRGGRVRLERTARFTERGAHQLDPFHASALVPLGLAQGRSIDSPALSFLVVPRIANVRRLAMPDGQRYQPGGVALASKTGESMELLGVRPYRPGDPLRDLHARRSARLGTPVVREYQQEYFSRVGVVLDTDEGAASPEQLEAAISLAAGVVAHLSRGEALVDVLVVGEEVHPLTVGRSLAFFEQALDLLACVKAGPPASPLRLVERLAPYFARLSYVVLVVLAWDDARRQLADAIRRRGIACRVLLVSGDTPAGARPGGPPPRRDAGPTELSAAAIEGREPLFL